jgi:hypothetical protein
MCLQKTSQTTRIYYAFALGASCLQQEFFDDHDVLSMTGKLERWITHAVFRLVLAVSLANHIASFVALLTH